MNKPKKQCGNCCHCGKFEQIDGHFYRGAICRVLRIIHMDGEDRTCGGYRWDGSGNFNTWGWKQ